MGRPTLCTPERTQRIAAAISDGLGVMEAIQYGPISHPTHYTWLERGEKAAELARSDQPVPEREQPFLAYATAITKATVDYERAAIDRIRQAAVGRPYTKTRTTTSAARRKDGSVVLDDAGEPVMLTDVTVEEGFTYSWQADAWLMERKFRERYSRTVNQVHTGADGGPVQTADVTREADLLGEIDRLTERLANANAGAPEPQSA